MLGVDLDVLYSFFLLNDHKLGILDYFLWTSPLKVLKEESPRRQIGSILIELRTSRGEIFIDPFVARVGGQPLENSVFFFIVLPHGVISFIFLLHACPAVLFVRRIFYLQFGVG